MAAPTEMKRSTISVSPAARSVRGQRKSGGREFSPAWYRI